MSTDLTPTALAAQARELVSGWFGADFHNEDDADIQALQSDIAAALGAVCDAARAEMQGDLMDARADIALARALVTPELQEAFLVRLEGRTWDAFDAHAFTATMRLWADGHDTLKHENRKLTEEVRQLREALAEEVGRSEYCDWCRRSETGELCIPHRLLATATEPSHG